MAFRVPGLQGILVDLENDIYRKRLAAAGSQSAVFVTGLPRSGTTLLLNLLYQTGEFTTFTYRQMPFLQIPLLWDRMSSPFQQQAVERERAHGDNVTVSFDSPEAFEEAIWLAFMREQIEAEDYLRPLGGDDYSPALAKALRQTITKLGILASTPSVQGAAPLRYLSKNNANVSRLAALRRLFPEAVIFVPFRTPAAHVASLMQQHQRFLAQHQDDAFSANYMRWLGHFEFGGNLKPINFGNWLNGRKIDPTAVDQDFWLEYWISAYQYVLDQTAAGPILVDFDGLLVNGSAALGDIASKAGLSAPADFVTGAGTLRSPTTRPLSADGFSSGLWRQAQDLHQRLVALASSNPTLP